MAFIWCVFGPFRVCYTFSTTQSPQFAAIGHIQSASQKNVSARPRFGPTLSPGARPGESSSECVSFSSEPPPGCGRSGRTRLSSCVISSGRPPQAYVAPLFLEIERENYAAALNRANASFSAEKTSLLVTRVRTGASAATLSGCTTRSALRYDFFSTPASVSAVC